MLRTVGILLLLVTGLTYVLWSGRGIPLAGTANQRVVAEPAWKPPKPDNHRWRCIVIHHSATHIGGANRFDQAHRRQGWDELAYHFVIGNGTDTADGEVEVGGRWTQQKHGAHCKTDDNFYNNHGIGICLVGNFDKTYPTRAQMAALKRLVRHLCITYDIPPSRIYTHGQVTGMTACPGRNFQLQPVREAAVR